METRTGERALIVECHQTMSAIAATFQNMAGKGVDPTDYNAASDAELLTEMRDALVSVQAQIGPALENPMVQMMLRRMTSR